MMTTSSTSSSVDIAAVRAHNATMFGQVYWNGKPVIDDDDGGTAGVREPRRPGPRPMTPAAMALEVEPDFVTA
jgi:hypothetical protein